MALHSLCVVVVEERGFYRGMALRLLSDLGLTRLHEAADGTAALALLEALDTRADVVIVDPDLPGMDGVEFIALMAERRLAHAIVVASAMGSPLIGSVELIAHTSGLQMLGAIEKPLSAGTLSAVLSTYRCGNAGFDAPAD